MPIETTWLDDEQTIICHRLINPLSIENFRGAFAQKENTKTNYVVVNAMAVDDLPRGLLVHNKSMTKSLNMATRVVVVATISDNLRVLAKSFLGLAGYSIVEFVESMGEAETCIRQIQAEHDL